MTIPDELVLLKDREWAVIDGEPCRVLNFTPFSVIENGKIYAGKSLDPYPHAVLTLECKKIQCNIKGHIWHKIDFRNLWKVFEERRIQDNEEVIIFWTIRHYKYFWGKYLSYFLPKLRVLVCHKGWLEFITHSGLKPESMSYEEMLRPIVDLKWSFME